ncbi:MAG: SDR family oxidoreductase, partial [Granulosicoccus sp.]
TLMTHYAPCRQESGKDSVSRYANLGACHPLDSPRITRRTRFVFPILPFGRIGKPEEIAALVAFLASDEAAFMCGSLVEITGAQPVA